MKISLLQVLADGAHSGSVAALASAVAIAVAGKIENNRPVEAINGISHIAWGESAFKAKKMDAKHTLLGLAINDVSMLSWGVMFEALRALTNSQHSPSRTVACSGVMGIVAWIFDYKVVPPRFTPGLERHLSSRAMWMIYGVFVLALALSTLKRRTESAH